MNRLLAHFPFHLDSLPHSLMLRTRILQHSYALRVEHADGYFDYSVVALMLGDARKKLQETFPEYANWRWFGAVAFVDGVQKAEDVF